MVARDVGDDLQNPGAKRRAAFEALEPLQHADPCVLDDVLGDVAPTDVTPRDREHGRIEVDDGLLKGPLFPIAQTCDERGVKLDFHATTRGLHEPSVTNRRVGGTRGA